MVLLPSSFWGLLQGLSVSLQYTPPLPPVQHRPVFVLAALCNHSCHPDRSPDAFVGTQWRDLLFSFVAAGLQPGILVEVGLNFIIRDTIGRNSNRPAGIQSCLNNLHYVKLAFPCPLAHASTIFPRSSLHFSCPSHPSVPFTPPPTGKPSLPAWTTDTSSPKIPARLATRASSSFAWTPISGNLKPSASVKPENPEATPPATGPNATNSPPQSTLECLQPT